MATEVVNPITSHQVVWMDTGFGWIRLLNGLRDAGYVYFLDDSTALSKPHLSSDKSYVVMSIHSSRLHTFLYILNNEKPLEIRFYDPEAAGVDPSAFIEPAAGSSVDSATIAAKAQELRGP